jgi:hypothetical protein
VLRNSVIELNGMYLQEVCTIVPNGETRRGCKVRAQQRGRDAAIWRQGLVQLRMDDAMTGKGALRRPSGSNSDGYARTWRGWQHVRGPRYMTTTQAEGRDSGGEARPRWMMVGATDDDDDRARTVV